MALTKITGKVVDTTTDLVVGVTTVGGGVSAVDGFFSGIVTFSQGVSIGGTLTYEDVTNVDSVGLITARAGVVVGSGITLSKDGDGFFTGVVTATSYVGDGSGLTGVASTDNIRTNTNATFLQNVNVSGSTTTGSLISSGAISGTTGTFSSAISGTTGTFTGDVDIADKIVHTGDTDTAIRFSQANQIQFETAGVERLEIQQSEAVFNDGGADFDFRVEGDTDTDLLTVDASTDRVGISEAAPAAKLHVGSGSDTEVGARITGGASGGTDIADFRTNNGTIRMKVNNDVTVSTGNLVIGTSGKGIDFSATADSSASGASAGSELLDDYEEGTWTPQVHDGTVSTLNANYTKIGRQVTVVARLYNFSDNSTNDAIRIKNLPFAANVTSVAAGSAMYSYTGDANKTTLYLDAAHDGSLNLYGGMASAFDQLRHNELNISGQQTDMYIVATYFAAS